jgi:catechol-2,3-dioxygenase
MILGFSHYNLRAPRALLEQLRAFYCDVVGLEVGVRPPFRSFGYWLYAGGKDILHLSECKPDEHRETHVQGTFDHVAFACAGRAAMENRLRQLGIPYEVAQVPQTGQAQLFFSDPAGNGVELNFADMDA